MKPEGIVTSPGPGTPDDAGICLQVISTLPSLAAVESLSEWLF
jgi:anthranilate/para-aminobenzoate synthase component II